jgi:hypothetical protein
MIYLLQVIITMILIVLPGEILVFRLLQLVLKGFSCQIY